MIAVTPERVLRDIAAVCALSQFNDHIRSHVLEEADLSQAAAEAGATKYIEARSYVAEPVQWRIFSHCASVTRLYALYEAFIYELISDWLKIVPSLYPSYARMPEALINQHRVGVGILLQKFGGGFRNQGLSELGIVEPLYSALSGQDRFSLISDAFFIDLRNLRHDELCSLFRRVSLDNLSGWLDGHTELQAMCDAAGTTVMGRLKELVDFRNDASHARQEIDETLGVSAFQQIAEFIQLLCRALHEFATTRYFDVLEEADRLELLGRVTEYLPRCDAAILTMSGTAQVSVGDAVIARGSRTAIATRIVSLQDQGQDVETISADGGYELGLRLQPTVARVGVNVYRVRPALVEGDGEVSAAGDVGAVPAAAPNNSVASAAGHVMALANEGRGTPPTEVTNSGVARNWVLAALRRLGRWFQR
jgi:hypothetical protein